MEFENPTGATMYSLENPWWKANNIDPAKINHGSPMFVEHWYQLTLKKKEEGHLEYPTFTTRENSRTYANKWIENGAELIYPSFLKVFVDHMDPTEYIFAMSVFDSYGVWEKIREYSRVKVEADKARHHLNMRLKALAVRKNVELADVMHQKASEFLLKRPWEEDGSSKVGRPRKKREEEDTSQEIANDASRINNIVPFTKPQERKSWGRFTPGSDLKNEGRQ